MDESSPSFYLHQRSGLKPIFHWDSRLFIFKTVRLIQLAVAFVVLYILFPCWAKVKSKDPIWYNHWISCVWKIRHTIRDQVSFWCSSLLLKKILVSTVVGSSSSNKQSQVAMTSNPGHNILRHFDVWPNFHHK